MENQQHLSLVSGLEADRREEKRSPSLSLYERHLTATIDWLHRSIDHGNGGSCAYYGVWGQWSKPYPETTGYIIPTLLSFAQYKGEEKHHDAAVGLGEWLLGIQDAKGYWHGGTYPPSKENPSIFNTAQILLGLNALYRATKEDRWLTSARRGAMWLAQGVGTEGQWRQGNYRSGFNPSYYTRVAWPMLDTWALTHDSPIREAAERVLKAILARRKENGVIGGWGFDPGKPAFTHTIAYTIRGLMESARLLENWETYGAPVEAATEYLFRQAELSRGQLAGAFFEDWKKVKSYTCLTGNAQVAICLLLLEGREPDLRLVNASCKLVDFVCNAQSLNHIIADRQGGVAGSRPIWGRYLTMRYPNWAAKFHSDALMMLIHRLQKEGL